ncbi:AraC family transcriptional regulator [uncultured Duncaniella sp.]|uniref:helix-turn-helix domain-containing protein n=1 Tax=uncultured Duncaniella sp. TaxID=2768039 RepID=UPI0025F694BB|nr:helix-turn-helix domain-containing protein [uncultured Duncaniella sp.]
MAESNIRIQSLLWDELTTANWDVIYKDCGVSLIEGDASFPALTGIYEVKMVAILICLNGRLTLSNSNSPFDVKTGDALVCLPGTILRHEKSSSDFRYKVLCLSPDVVAKHSAKKGYFTKFSNRKTPFVKIHFDSLMLSLIDAYYSILEIKIKEDDIADQDVIVSNIVGCLLFDVLKRIPDTQSVEPIRQTQGYKYVIFQNFIQLVAKDNGILRFVKEYARRLNISPKYLSAICRESSGKSASEWITEILNTEIERMLRYTDLSMKEISVCLEFSNCSVFSKYIRQHFNMSGVEYRNYLRKHSQNT